MSFVCARALKGKLISQNWGTCATRHPGWNYIFSGSPLPSAITNEPPVIENNRCARVMPSEDRTLATPSIYEPVIRAHWRGRRVAAFFDDATISWCTCSQSYKSSSNSHFHAKLHSRSHSLHIRVLIKGGCLFLSSLRSFLWESAPYSYSRPIHASRKIVRFITKLQRDRNWLQVSVWIAISTIGSCRCNLNKRWIGNNYTWK